MKISILYVLYVLYYMYYTFRIIVSMKFSEKDEAGFRRVSSDYYKTTF